jgi:hypothetical protein
MSNAKHNTRKSKRRRRTLNAISLEEKGIRLENVHVKM